MGKRGPLPKAALAPVREIRGNPGKRAAKEVARLRPAPPQMPPDLERDERAAAEWRLIVPQLDERGFLSKVDAAVLAAYCRAVSVAEQAYESLRAGGLTSPDRDGADRKSPSWQIWREATTLVAMLGKELLVTPASRLRTTLPEGHGGGDDTEAGALFD